MAGPTSIQPTPPGPAFNRRENADSIDEGSHHWRPVPAKTLAAMKRNELPLDDDTLAAYISNTLPPDVRATVTRKLLRDPESREVLAMAAKAIGEERMSDRGRLRVESRDRTAERPRSARTPESDRARKTRSR